MSFIMHRNGDSLTVEIEGQVVVQNREALKHAILDQIKDEGVRHVRLDLTYCGYLDAAALGALVAIANRLHESGGSRVVCSGMNEDLRTLFDVTKLDTLFTIVDSAPSAGNLPAVPDRETVRERRR